MTLYDLLSIISSDTTVAVIDEGQGKITAKAVDFLESPIILSSGVQVVDVWAVNDVIHVEINE